MKDSTKVAILLTLQFLSMGGFFLIVFLTSERFELPGNRIIGAILALLGGVVFVMSIMAHRRYRGTTMIKVSPTPHEQGGLITAGIYGLVRHPMYLAAILLFVGVAVFTGSLYGLLFCLPIAGFLYIKTLFEEDFLTQRFPEYREYCKTTGRFLPRIFQR